jgi:hypothetical protein
LLISYYNVNRHALLETKTSVYIYTSYPKTYIFRKDVHEIIVMKYNYDQGVFFLFDYSSNIAYPHVLCILYVYNISSYNIVHPLTIL